MDGTRDWQDSWALRLFSLSPRFKLAFCFLPQRQVKMMYLNRISELLMALKLYTSCIRFMCPNGRGA